MTPALGVQNVLASATLDGHDNVPIGLYWRKALTKSKQEKSHEISRDMGVSCCVSLMFSTVRWQI